MSSSLTELLVVLALSVVVAGAVALPSLASGKQDVVKQYESRYVAPVKRLLREIE